MQRNLNTIYFELEQNRYHIEENRLQQRNFPIDHPIYASLVQRENILLCIRANLFYGRAKMDERLQSGKF